MSRIKLSFVFLVLICSSISVWAQTTRHTYDVYIGKDKSGKTEVAKEIKGTETIYTFHSKATYHIMGISQEIEEKLTVIFSNGKLLSSDMVLYKNGDKHKTTVVNLLTNGHYKIVTNGNEHYFQEPITFSSIMLYFQSPTIGMKTFAEGDGVLKTVSSEEEGREGVFVVREGHHGTPSTFMYKNGELSRVVVDYHITTFEMRKVQ